ncbi:SRPBCC family protein [Streptomyces beigongshangae]|uniref:SRPBCC family protein n=1 Tax=Streptomyces beigongshangae TaxID=2841597 RepID=UPI001C86038A|nr:SRPBCC family protein [Streptomyces sp. REN17]
MRCVELRAVLYDEDATAALDRIGAWERYPELAPHVNATEVHAAPPAEVCSSSWELHFRSGLLSWSEEEEFLPEQLIIRFAQTHGDFESFSGRWELRRTGDDVEVLFRADFDFGIPSMEGILDPIAERVLKESVAWALTGLFPRAEILGETDLIPARGDAV